MLTGVINLRWLRTLEAALQRCFAAAEVCSSGAGAEFQNFTRLGHVSVRHR
jgi:hypothetical protein